MRPTMRPCLCKSVTIGWSLYKNMKTTWPNFGNVLMCIVKFVIWPKKRKKKEKNLDDDMSTWQKQSFTRLCLKSQDGTHFSIYSYDPIPLSILWEEEVEEEEDMGVDLDLESISEATSGAIGSLLSTTILYPLDTCKSKFQAEIRVRGQQKYRFVCSSFLHLIVTR